MPYVPIPRVPRAGAAIMGLLGALLFLAAPAALRAQVPPAGQDPAKEPDEYALLVQDGQRKLSKGTLGAAAAAFNEVLDALDEEPEGAKPGADAVAAARAGLFAIALRHGQYEDVLRDIGALPAAERQRPQLAGMCARALRALGRCDEAAALWQQRLAADATDFEARYELGEAQCAAGLRRQARATWQAAVDLPAPPPGRQLAFRGRCRWRLGGGDQIVAASEDLVAALAADPELWEARTTLGMLRFEAYGEARGFPSGERDLARVLEEHGEIEEALLALYRLRSSNFQLDPGKTERYLERALALNPRSVPAIALRGAAVLDDRRYHDAAELLDQALAIDPHDLTALAHRAAAALLLRDAGGYQRFRAAALRGDPGYADVDRIVGDHLVALYRFADSLPYYEAALQQDQADVASLQGMAKALIYVGEGARAKELLLRAKAQEPGFVDPWRTNALAVQDLLDKEYVVEQNDQFALSLYRDEREVLREYMMPVFLQALDVLGRKYGYRPDRQVKVETFHTWDDFSVRTIGFRGFTALGACFGPFITLVSPVDTDVRRQDFMWEATVWHEYTHVLTLGLSHHRVPRWLTEGFSVYEEKARDPAWERGMDRDLFDAFHNQDIPPVRLLNRLFRGPRILFGYYQGGLIVELIARDHGFGKAIELLRAFGDDLDSEDAFQRALGMSTREFDRTFLQFVERDRLRGMRLVPRFDDASLQRLQVAVAREPGNTQARIDLAWAFAQRDDPVDAGTQLAAVLQKDPEQAAALLVRAALLHKRGATAEAIDCWRRGFAGGADDFDSRIACGRALLQQGDAAGAAEQFQRAKACWPGCTEQENAPELLLARIYRDEGRSDQAMMETKSYCRRTARAYTPRWTLAEFERQAGNRAEEARYLEDCNRIDPFRRELHKRLGDAYVALGRKADAAREYEVGAAVPPALDREYARPDAERPAADDPSERQARGNLWLEAARLRREVGDAQRAAALLQRVLQEAPGTDAAVAARALAEEWRAH